MLIPKATSTGRAMACEIMVVTPAIRALIRDDKVHQIYSSMQSGKKHGMQTLNDSLYGLVSQNQIRLPDALRVRSDQTELRRMLGEELNAAAG